MRIELNMRPRRFQQCACAGLLLINVFVAAAQSPTLKTRTKEERDSQFQERHRITLNVQVTGLERRALCGCNKHVDEKQTSTGTLLKSTRPHVSSILIG